MLKEFCKKHTIICALCFFLVGCGTLPAQGNPTSFAPTLAVTALPLKETDKAQPVTPASTALPTAIGGDYRQDEIFLEEFETRSNPDLPGMVYLHIKGQLLTPCHQFGSQICPSCAQSEPNLIVVSVYSLIETERVCRGPTTPFETDIPLGIYTEGEYSVEVNGEQVLTFDAAKIDD